MKTRLLTTTALTLLIALPAFAETTYTSPTVGERLDQGVAATQQAVADAAEKIRDMMAEKDSSGAYSMVTINMNTSAAGMIGQQVHNAKNEQVAKVEDILINSYGNAAQIILTNGGFLGVGNKLVAVDFALVYMRNGDSDVIVPITEETIKNMVPFAYEASEVKDGVRTIPTGYLSAKAMLEGHLFDGRGTKVGAIENVSLRGGRANQVVVSYNTTLGIGGNKLAVSYDQLQKMGHGSVVDFKLNDPLTARFEAFTKAVN
jgi:sporulation protein YlmC with PRC-barrel domain